MLRRIRYLLGHELVKLKTRVPTSEAQEIVFEATPVFSIPSGSNVTYGGTYPSKLR